MESEECIPCALHFQIFFPFPIHWILEQTTGQPSSPTPHRTRIYQAASTANQPTTHAPHLLRSRPRSTTSGWPTGKDITTETPSPLSRTQGIPLTAAKLPVILPTLETDANRSQRFTSSLADLNFPGNASPTDNSMPHDTRASYRHVLRGMPSGFISPHRPGVHHTIPRIGHGQRGHR
jgi:hypothetical protein